MKKLIMIFMLAAGLAACKKDDNSNVNDYPTTNPNPNPNEGLITEGKWMISNFDHKGNNETSKFDGCVFQFNTDGTINVEVEGFIVKGNWSYGSDDSNKKLIITFESRPLNELNNDWIINKQNSSIIDLEDISGGNGGTEFLAFEKI